MAFDHDGCVGCKFVEKMSDEYPCIDCKCTVEPLSCEYENHPDMWKPSDSESGICEEDAVNHPYHYTQGDIECIDAMESAFGAEELAIYCKIAAFKYIWRTEHKNGLEDVKKALWYMKKFIELTNKLTGKDV